MAVTLLVTGALGTIPKESVKGLNDVEIRDTCGDHLDFSIIKIGQNTEKSIGNLRRLAVTHTPVENHQLTLV